jgi:hypothetical protein
MARKPIEIEELTEEQANKIWEERIKEAQAHVKRARQFVSKHKLGDEDVLFIGGLIKILDGILYKKGGRP